MTTPRKPSQVVEKLIKTPTPRTPGTPKSNATRPGAAGGLTGSKASPGARGKIGSSTGKKRK